MKKINTLIAILLILVTTNLVADGVNYKVQPGEAYSFKGISTLAGDVQLPPFLNKMLLNYLGIDSSAQNQWAFDINEEVVSDFKIIEVDEKGNATIQCVAKTRSIHALLTLKDAMKRDIFYTQEGTKVTFVVKDGDIEVSNQVLEGKPLFKDPITLVLAPNGKILKFMGSGIKDHRIIGEIGSMDVSEKTETNNGIITTQAEAQVSNGSLSFLSPFLKDNSIDMPYTIKTSYQFEINQQKQ